MRENGAHMTRSVHLRALQLSYYTFQVKTFGVGSLEQSVKLGRLVIFNFLSNSLL